MSDAVTDADPTVLVVDAEPSQVELAELWLDDDYDVETAANGRSALDAMHDGVDVLVTDRYRSGVADAEPVDRIRVAGYDCPVVITSAVIPGLDVVDLAFDAYLVKPFAKADLRDAVRRALTIDVFSDAERAAHRAHVTRTLLERYVPRSELEGSEAYAGIVAATERHGVIDESDVTATESTDRTRRYRSSSRIARASSDDR